jgi:hypothetical protein
MAKVLWDCLPSSAERGQQEYTQLSRESVADGSDMEAERPGPSRASAEEGATSIMCRLPQVVYSVFV